MEAEKIPRRFSGTEANAFVVKKLGAEVERGIAVVSVGDDRFLGVDDVNTREQRRQWNRGGCHKCRKH